MNRGLTLELKEEMVLFDRFLECGDLEDNRGGGKNCCILGAGERGSGKEETVEVDDFRLEVDAVALSAPLGKADKEGVGGVLVRDAFEEILATIGIVFACLDGGLFGITGGEMIAAGNRGVLRPELLETDCARVRDCCVN